MAVQQRLSGVGCSDSPEHIAVSFRKATGAAFQPAHPSGPPGAACAQVLGFGDFYYELGVQIVEACLATRALNGGLLDMRSLLRFVTVLLPLRRWTAHEKSLCMLPGVCRWPFSVPNHQWAH